VGGFCALRSASSRAFSAARLRARASATFACQIATAAQLVASRYKMDFHLKSGKNSPFSGLQSRIAYGFEP